MPYAAAGATWWLVGFPPDTVTTDLVRGVLRDGSSREDVTDVGDTNG
jgi:hypothetical protein